MVKTEGMRKPWKQISKLSRKKAEGLTVKRESDKHLATAVFERKQDRFKGKQFLNDFYASDSTLFCKSCQYKAD